MIAVDWGTSSFRAYRLGAGGTVLEARNAGRGILSVPENGWAEVLHAEVGDWLGAERLMLLSGMVGSRQGWREAPYVGCPCDAADLAASLVPLDWDWPGRTWLVPGLECRHEGTPDVMRGEEVQILGALGQLPGETGLACLPGTHSKWVDIEAGRISSFRTYMTGEVFGALRGHSILGRLMSPADEDTDPEHRWFLEGVRRAGDPGGLLHHLFGVRARGLYGEVPVQSLGPYLSGILIGHELQALPASSAAVHLIGSAALVGHYALALEKLGRRCHVLEPDSAAAGLYRLAQAVEERGS